MTSGSTQSDIAKPVPSMDTRGFVARRLDAVKSIMFGKTERDALQRNALIAFSVRVASAGLLYLSQMLLARWMGGSQYGTYVVIWTWVLVLGGLSHLGMSMAMIRLVPEYTETKQFALLRGLLAGGRVVALSVGTLISLLGLIGLWLFGHRLAPQSLLPAYLALVCIPVFALTDLHDGVGRGHGWIGSALIPPYIVRPLVLLLVMAGAQAAGLAMTATTAAAAAIAATWLAAATQAIVMYRNLPDAAKRGPRVYAFRDWFGTSLPLLVTYAAELVLQNADVILLAAYRPPQDVGMYFAAAKTMALVMFVHYAVGSAVAHRYSTLNARGDATALAGAVRDAVRWTFFPSLAAAIGILAVGWPLLWLFSPEFTKAYPVMVILVIGFLARASIGPAEFLLNTLGEQKQAALVAIGAAAVNLVLNLVLIPRYGLYGAAFGTASALVFAALANYAVVRRRLGFGISIFENLR